MELAIRPLKQVSASLMLAMFFSAGLVRAEIPADDPIVMAYAKDAKLSKQEARKFLALQELAGDLQAQVAATMPEIFGGFYIDHDPRFQVVVQLTDGDESLIDPLLTRRLNALRPFLKVQRVERSLVELEAEVPKIAALIREVGVIADLDIDIRNNLVTVNVTDPAQLITALEAAGKSLPTGSAILHVRELTRPLAAITGGLSIRQCTSGFGVIHPDGRRGIATAAHCDNNAQYYPDYSNNLLPWLSGVYGGDWDIQWHSTPGYTPTNLVWDGWNYVSITGLKYRGSQSIGEYVCKNGRMTGYTCGYIRSTAFAPGSIPNANPTWVTFGSTATYGEEGDSGAPIWKGNTAYGILHGVYYDYSYGEYRLVYMPADGVYSGLGVYILVSP